MEEKRFLLAMILSAAILFGWSYLLPQQTPKPNTPQQTVDNAPAPTPEQNPTPAQAENSTASPTPSADDVPQRTLTVSTPLYEAKFDTRGAVATSWIIKLIRKKGSERPIYSVAGDKNHPQPLQLIPPQNLQREAGNSPLSLATGDNNLDAILASRNYRVEGVEGEGDLHLDLKPGESKQVNFVMRDATTGLDVTKSITFKADQYNVDFAAKLARDGRPVPVAKLIIGPSIGDQGVSRYSFYSVAPEGVASTGGAPNWNTGWFPASTIHSSGEGWFSSKRPEGADHQLVRGQVNWAGIADSYFAMVAVPSKTIDGLEFITKKYDYEAEGKKEERYLVSGFVPIPVDGSPTHIYVGPKDLDLLAVADHNIKDSVGRKVDLEGMINYGFLSIFSRPLATPILWSIEFLSKLTGSYGIAIILFTVVIYSLFFPLKWRSSKSMKKAQKLAPRMKELQEKIKGIKQNDPRLKELQMEQLRLMKEGNPLGGCLPLLIQMPFLFALYRAITISIDFRQVPFLWIPDLSAPEPSAIHFLPILMAGSMLILQLITPAPSTDPMQRRMMAFMMPALMLYMLWSAPAGLLVYWLVGNIVGFSQQVLINRMIKSKDDNEEPPGEKKVEPRPVKKLNAARAS